MMWLILLVVFIFLMCAWGFLGTYSAPTGNVLVAQRGIPFFAVLILAILTLADLERPAFMATTSTHHVAR